jgi:acetyltransferase-like isoleucine patch superfamily enzyme
MWRHLGKTRTAKVVIRDNCYIGYGTIVLPGVTIGPDSIVGAGSVVTRDVPPRTVVAGVPARPLCDLDAFLVKHRLAMENKTMGYTD